MNVALRRRLFLQLLMVPMMRTPASAQPFDAKALAAYRLSEPVFKRFAHATRLIGKVIATDARYAREPLITEDISVSGDAPEMAMTLQQRLDGDPALATALFAAEISAREYATFAIALFAARLARGFVESGAMRRVPQGIAADNVAFVGEHAAEVATIARQLNLP
jgi:hypothetical protein